MFWPESLHDVESTGLANVIVARGARPMPFVGLHKHSANLAFLGFFFLQGRELIFAGKLQRLKKHENMMDQD